MLRSCWCLGLSGCELKPQLRKIAHCDVNIQPSGILLCGIEATQLINMILAVGLRDKSFILSNTFSLFLGFLSSACCSELPRFAYCCLPVNCSLRCLHLRLYLFVLFFFSGKRKPTTVRSVCSPCLGQICPFSLPTQKKPLAGDTDGRVQEAQAVQ